VAFLCVLVKEILVYFLLFANGDHFGVAAGIDLSDRSIHFPVGTFDDRSIGKVKP
jgi:hypothetical protein